MEENKPEGKQSEYNEASLKMMRLNNLQREANYFQANGDCNGWFTALASLYKELYGKLTNDEKKYGADRISEIGRKLNTSINVSNAEMSGLLRIEGYNVKAPTSMLFEFDCWIRQMLDSHHYGSPEAEEGLF